MKIDKPKDFHINRELVRVPLSAFIASTLNTVGAEYDRDGYRWCWNLNIISYLIVSQEIIMNWDWASDLKRMFNLTESIDEIDECIKQTIFEIYGHN